MLILTDIISGAVDFEGDDITIKSIGGSTVHTNDEFPLTVGTGTASINRLTGNITYNEATTVGHPREGETATSIAFNYVITDETDPDVVARGQTPQDSPSTPYMVEFQGAVVNVVIVPAEAPEPISNVVTTPNTISFDAPPIPADLGGGVFVRMLAMIMPRPEYEAGNFNGSVIYPVLTPDGDFTLNATNYPGIATASEHMVKVKVINNSPTNNGGSNWSDETYPTLQAVANAPSWDTNDVNVVLPSMLPASPTSGDDIQFDLGAPVAANPVTLAPVKLLLGTAVKLADLSPTQLWDTDGEPEGVITFQVEATDDVTGAKSLSPEITGYLQPVVPVVGGGPVAGETPVNNQAELLAAIAAGDPMIYLNQPGNYVFDQGLPGLPTDLNIRGTHSTVMRLRFTGNDPARSVTIDGVYINQTISSFRAAGQTLTIKNCLGVGPTSHPIGSAAHDRMLRAKIDVTGLASQPTIGAAVTSATHNASTKITEVYDWNQATGACTVAVSDNPAKTVGGTAYGATNLWRSGHNIQIAGAGSGTTQTGIYGGDPLMQNGVDFVGTTVGTIWKKVVFDNNEFAAWGQAIETSAIDDVEVTDNLIHGFTADAIKFHVNDVTPNQNILDRGNVVFGVLANGEYKGNFHSDARQGQMYPVSNNVSHKGTVLITEGVSTAEGYISGGYLQGFVMSRWAYDDMTIEKNAHDCGNGTLGILANASAATIRFNTMVSSDNGIPNGGNRSGGVFINPGNGTMTNNICEIVDGANDPNNTFLTKFGGANNAGYTATFVGGKSLVKTGDMGANMRSWLAARAGITDGCFDQAGNFR